MTESATAAPFTDNLWPLPLNWSIALGAIVLFWCGVLCGAFWILWTT